MRTSLQDHGQPKLKSKVSPAGLRAGETEIFDLSLVCDPETKRRGSLHRRYKMPKTKHLICLVSNLSVDAPGLPRLTHNITCGPIDVVDGSKRRSGCQRATFHVMLWDSAASEYSENNRTREARSKPTNSIVWNWLLIRVLLLLALFLAAEDFIDELTTKRLHM